MAAAPWRGRMETQVRGGDDECHLNVKLHGYPPI
jgi:hypothetical protein